MTANAFKSWTPAVPAKHQDNIVSSEFTTAKIFKPSYEKEEICMEQLLANEYQRMWLTERDEWLKKIAESSDDNKRRMRINDKNVNKKENVKSRKTARSDAQSIHSKRGEK